MELFASLARIIPVALGVVAVLMFFVVVPILATRSRKRELASARQLTQSIDTIEGVQCSMTVWERGWSLLTVRPDDPRAVELFVSRHWAVQCVASIPGQGPGFGALMLYPRGKKPGRGYGVEAQRFDDPVFDGRFDLYRGAP